MLESRFSCMTHKTIHFNKAFLKGSVSHTQNFQIKVEEVGQVTYFKDCALVSFEKIPTVRLYVLLGYLRYSICTIKIELSKTSCVEKRLKLKWLLKTKKLLTNLMYLNKSDSYCSTDEYLVRKIGFADKSPYICDGPIIQTSTERLHSRESLQMFPKEIRNYLLQGEYLNFEISNSKTRILLQFAPDNFLTVPTLASFVLRKDDALQFASNESEYSEEFTKRSISSSIDSSKYSSISRIFPGFFLEISLIPSTMLSSDAINEHQGTKRNELCLVHGGSYDQSKLGHVMQESYCQAEETAQILKLIDFLKDKHRYQSLLPTTLSGEHQLRITSFFDSIYISSSIESFQSRIDSYIDQYNEHYSDPLIVF